MSKDYGCTKPYQHKFKNDVCEKCHKHVSKLKMKICAVMGEEEVRALGDPIADTYIGKGKG